MTDDKERDIEMYTLVCRERFNNIDSRFTSIDGKQDQIINLLKGKNGDPGLLDDVRTLKGRWKWIYGTAGMVAAIVIRSIVIWISDKI